jgi:hypothetical protein
VRWWRPDLSPDDLAALGTWAAAHLALFVLAWAAAWVYRATPSHAPLACQGKCAARSGHHDAEPRLCLSCNTAEHSTKEAFPR